MVCLVGTLRVVYDSLGGGPPLMAIAYGKMHSETHIQLPEVFGNIIQHMYLKVETIVCTLSN